nr:F64 [uncultured bacterium]
MRFRVRSRISECTISATGGFSYIVDENDVVDFAFPDAFPKTLENNSLPETGVPLKTTHVQITAGIAFEKWF